MTLQKAPRSTSKRISQMQSQSLDFLLFFFTVTSFVLEFRLHTDVFTREVDKFVGQAQQRKLLQI